MNAAETFELLIIDDRKENIDMISGFLHSATYRIQGALNSDEALAKCACTEFDLILLDVRMPVDGFRVFDLIKTSKMNADTPVVFMVEKTDMDAATQAIRIGARDVLGKPFRPDTLVSKIATHAFLQKQGRQLKALIAAKDEMLRIIIHDLRAPFNALVASSDILIEALKTTSDTNSLKYAGIINAASVNGIKLLDGLAAYAISLDEKLQLSFTRLNLNELISEIIETMRPVATLKLIDLIRDTDGPVFISASRELIASVLRNFLTNAIKFTDAGGQVIVKTEISVSTVAIIVSDTGTGMDEEALNALFDAEKHWSTTGTHGETGTGKGLLQSKEIIDRHGGTLSVESRQGQGTSFRITFRTLSV